ncbi:sulfurtransferase TusA family protein [Campylobacter ureolyticus]|uniref:sulfurtransferase TusA family protein n=1 Tax=Campylobacter ureolyticus TaxID=827 RepID=UPI00290E2ED4|nr:sulfurtransferase TusA family protein [Campylobacter ureolyticus]MDU7070598.1 sulfurtransferase TusA family protein [Campylobacter ureolyticus]
MVKVDARGLSCPEPVLRLKEKIDINEKEIELLINCGAAEENAKRMAFSHGYELISKEENGETLILRFAKR